MVDQRRPRILEPLVHRDPPGTARARGFLKRACSAPAGRVLFHIAMENPEK